MTLGDELNDRINEIDELEETLKDKDEEILLKDDEIKSLKNKLEDIQRILQS